MYVLEKITGQFLSYLLDIKEEIKVVFKNKNKKICTYLHTGSHKLKLTFSSPFSFFLPSLCMVSVVEKLGGKCLPCIVDIREESQVISAVEEAVKRFGGIDILVNNASAISLTG